MIDHSFDVPGRAHLHTRAPAATMAFGLWLAIVLLAAPRPAAAGQQIAATVGETTAAGFAQPGQVFVALGTESLLTGMWARGFQKTFNLQAEPAVGYFFTEHVYGRLGLELQLDQLPRAAQDVGDIRTFAVALTPSIGGVWHLHPKISVAPRVGVGVGRVWRSLAFSGYRSTVDVQIGVPFVFDFVDPVSFFVEPSYKQLVVNRETFPDSHRAGPPGGRFGIAMGALAHF